jgi:hypothetical protein
MSVAKYCTRCKAFVSAAHLCRYWQVRPYGLPDEPYQKVFAVGPQDAAANFVEQVDEALPHQDGPTLAAEVEVRINGHTEVYLVTAVKVIEYRAERRE